MKRSVLAWHSLLTLIAAFLIGHITAATSVAAEKKITSAHTTHVDKKLGIQFQYPGRFVVGAFKQEPYPAELIDRGFEIPFKNSIVLVEPGQLRKFSRDAIPVGEIPALWLDVLSGERAKFSKKISFREQYKITIGGRTVYRLPGFPGPYGDQAFYYLIPIKNDRILEITAHKYYFRNSKIKSSGKHPDTQYADVIESILQSLQVLDL